MEFGFSTLGDAALLVSGWVMPPLEVWGATVEECHEVALAAELEK
jgi:hypothetical protein